MNDHDVRELCRVYLISWYPLISFFRITICLLKVETLNISYESHTNTLKKPALRHRNPLECGYTFQMNSERKIPLWCEFHSAATSLSLYQARAFEKGVCIFLKAITDHTLLCWRWWAQQRVKIYLACTIPHPVVGLRYFPLPFTVRWETMMKQEKQLWQMKSKSGSYMWVMNVPKIEGAQMFSFKFY